MAQPEMKIKLEETGLKDKICYMMNKQILINPDKREILEGVVEDMVAGKTIEIKIKINK